MKFTLNLNHQNMKYVVLLFVGFLASRYSSLSTVTGILGLVVFMLVAGWLASMGFREISNELDLVSRIADPTKRMAASYQVSKSMRKKKMIILFYLLILAVFLQDILIEYLSRQP